jgi:hypothetical protein
LFGQDFMLPLIDVNPLLIIFCTLLKYNQTRYTIEAELKRKRKAEKS